MRRAVFVALVGAVSSGCTQPCYRLCEERADAFEECFEPWYLSWQSFEVDGRTEYVEVCFDAADAERNHLNRVLRREFDDGCQAALDAHRQAEDCDTHWEVFSESEDYVP